MRTGELFDVVGIGFGPGGIALAAALHEEAPDLRCVFLESRSEAAWQPGMLLRGADTQHHPSRDLATLRDPRSRFTFLNYLHETDRLLAFLNVPTHFPLRRDYARYVRWVADQLADSVRYDSRVVRVAIADGHYVVETAQGGRFHARALVVGTGRSPYVPAPFAEQLGDRVFHSSEYLWRLEKLRRHHDGPLRAVVLGASQSAAEVSLDLHDAGDCVHIVTRGFGFRLKDTSPFSEEAYFPEHTDYYYAASRENKALLDNQLRSSNYSSVDQDVLESLYVRRYEDGIDGDPRLVLHRNSEVRDIEAGDAVRLALRESTTGEHTELTCDLVVLATGYRDLGPRENQEAHPPVLSDVVEHLAVDDRGVLSVDRDYFVPPRTPDVPPLFLNGLCETTHGLGDAGSFSLLSLRARTLLTAIRTHLPDQAG